MEDHDSQINEESMSDFWVVDWGIGYDYRSEDPIVSQIHKNELIEEENAPHLLNNIVGPYKALPSDWKDLFFMFQDDSIKEKPSKIVGNSYDSNIEEIKEYASLGRATDKCFFFVFEHFSPGYALALEKDVCDDVHSPSLDKELLSPMKKQESWFFPKYNDESNFCSPNDQNNIILNMPESFSPPYPEDDRPEIVLHQRLIYLIIDISISWLEDQVQSSRLVSFPSSRVPFYGIWVSCFPTSRPHNSLYHYSHLYCRVDCKNNHGSMHSCIDQLTCWLHWVYDYT